MLIIDVLPLLLIILIAIYLLYKWSTRVSISHIPGPESKSFLYGNITELLQVQAGEVDFKWQRMYGDVVRVRAPFGEDRLLISDPKAIQYVYHTASYAFPKPQSRRQISGLMFGRGLTFLVGEDHVRQRRVMNPAFGFPEAKSYIPIFSSCAEKMVQKWIDLITDDNGQSTVIEVTNWLSRATLDAIGEAAFDYQFNALDEPNSPLVKAYSNVFFDVFGIPSNFGVLYMTIMDHLPSAVVSFILKHFPAGRMAHAAKTKELSTELSKQLIAEKSRDALSGGGSRDLMSLLIKAHKSSDPKAQLKLDELLAEDKLRAEIHSAETRLHERGETRFGLTDFDAMPYMLAVLKETLRFHPVAYNIFRVAGQDDVLPLSSPITTTSGKVLHELPIPKGVQIMSSVAACNRNKEVFGEDAHIFNPDRWLRESPKQKVALGVYAGLFTFSGGPRSCIGWRFAVMELQAVIVAIMSKFEFAFVEGHGPERIRRESCFAMTPTVEGEVEKGSKLLLMVTLGSKNE
ncbi:cytochrome P450 [Desarmillaria tabescens]|uniref:Cytochrome P450 n=1 Tax=Armillaria tabescens TaxID=1929756 RepID=A0AA39JH42_ARMTA|nr:cytochrome P450 [Desarmillaria tabescens]KAK0442017.1 cytochrome P450 [Desarmillaria tabescens]